MGAHHVAPYFLSHHQATLHPRTQQSTMSQSSCIEDLSPCRSNTMTEAPPSQSQTSEILTQNPDLTQLGDEDGTILSPLPPFSPRLQRSQPWGRLIPAAQRPALDLLPRPPSSSSRRATAGGVAFLGFDNIHASDIFNEHVLGRSPKCDLPATKPSTEASEGQLSDEATRQQWAYGVISNRHCRIVCSLESNDSVSFPRMQVFVEDMSGNGTVINKTVVLRRGEKRLLHTGDEICLVNPQTLKKKIRSASILTKLLDNHSFVFVNLHQQQPSLSAQVLQSAQMNPPASSGSARKTAVNVRETRQHSNYKSKQTGIEVLGWRELQSRHLANKIIRKVSRFEEDYDIRDILGSGTVGEVRRAIHRRTGKERAVKVISIGGRNRALAQAQSAASLQAEASILRKLKHPYVVQLFDVYPATKNSKNVYLVMELLQGGDLFDRIVEKGKYTETESRRVMRRLLNAIHYLHEERNIVHRDLKPENILCVHRGADRCVDVKLTDFGLAKAVNGSQDSLKTFCGTPQYFAPEVLQRRGTVAGRGRYGKPADMWSLGVILYVLLSGTQPFDLDLDNGITTGAKKSSNENSDELSMLQFPDEHWKGVSESARDLIRTLLVVDSHSRSTVKQACEHTWILTDDGDTHVHPLDDPAAPNRVRDRKAHARAKYEQDSQNPLIVIQSSSNAFQSPLAKSPDTSNNESVHPGVCKISPASISEPVIPTPTQSKEVETTTFDQASNGSAGSRENVKPKSDDVCPRGGPSNTPNVSTPQTTTKKLPGFESTDKSSPDDIQKTAIKLNRRPLSASGNLCFGSKKSPSDTPSLKPAQHTPSPFRTSDVLPPFSVQHPARVSDFPEECDHRRRTQTPEEENDEVESFGSERSESISSFVSSDSPVKRKNGRGTKPNKREAPEDSDEKESRPSRAMKKAKKDNVSENAASAKRQTTLSQWFKKTQ